MADRNDIADRIALADLFQSARIGLRTMRHRGPSEVQVWFLALVIGIGAGFAALFFRKGINALQSMLYGTDDITHLATRISVLPWWQIMMWPILGGTIVGIILHRFAPGGRVRSVADVIEGAALYEGRVETRAGLASAVSSLITLGSGGSTGREGPVVHLAAVLATWVNKLLDTDAVTARDLLGCAVAAAVSASFNAPIAGALFAMEVILRHFAVRAFAPIVIAAAAGTVIVRLEFGDITEFDISLQNTLGFYQELPAFLLLGLICGLMGVVLMKSIFFADEIANGWQSRLRIPGWARPAIAGALLGALALLVPQIIGVGYETTSLALTGQLDLQTVILLAVAKTAAVAITMGGRMGGGVFSPSLMLGSLVGLAFGLIATSLAPTVSGEVTLYALAGMGAVAAAVLGAPISTTLIVFELTGNWQTGLAVMMATSTSTGLASKLIDRSFFLTQLERRQIHLSSGPQDYVLKMFRVANVMRPRDHARAPSDDAVWDAIEASVHVDGNATLDRAMPIFERTARLWIPVVRLGAKGESPTILGTLHHVDALKQYNRSLAATAREEHA